MSDVIVLDKLSKAYGQTTVVNQLSFTVERGSIFGYLGPNGSGKTTTIKMLCGLVVPTNGQAYVNGHSVTAAGDAIRMQIGYMSQQFSLYRALTVEQNLNFYAELYGLDGQRAKERKQQVIEITGMEEYRQRKAQELSGGWKQRLALACAIIHSPPVVFLDEPTAGIDPVARRALWDLLFSLASDGTTFFVTTHYMDEAERCSNVGYIYQSNLIALGKVDELTQLPVVNDPSLCHYELHCQQIMAGFQFFRALPYVKDVTIFGRSLHIVVPQEITADDIARAVEHTDLGISDVHRITPSLEDVFVTLTEREDRKRAFAKEGS